jgi:hypothetical protein
LSTEGAHAVTRINEHHRRGSIYVMTLGATTAVVVIGLAAVTAVRIQRRNVGQTMDFTEARMYAQSAIDLGMRIITADDTWRSGYSSGPWLVDAPIGRGTYSLDVVDSVDGDFTVNPEDSLFLTGTGAIGEARYRLHATLLADVAGLSCLEVAFSTAGDLAMDDATANCNQTVSSNGSVNGVAACQINGSVEAVGTVAGVNVSGSTTTGITPRTMPDTSTVYDYYIANGTSIDITAIPNSGGLYEINGVVLSPMSNPFEPGVTNSKGIYTINAMGSRIDIRDTRIVGTLLILNGSPICSYVQGAVNWEPAISNYPALLVQGPLCLYMDGSVPLDEGGTSLNPEGTPYGDPGNWDDDTGDTYPSIIKGLVYAESRLDGAAHAVVNGVVVSGGIANLTPFFVFDLTFDSTYLANPPPGFAGAPKMKIAQGSWRQLVD